MLDAVIKNHHLGRKCEKVRSFFCFSVQFFSWLYVSYSFSFLFWFDACVISCCCFETELYSEKKVGTRLKSAQKKESVLVDVDIICFHLNSGLISKWFFDHENLGDWTRTERWPAGDGLLGSSCHPDRGSLRCWGNTSLDFSVAQTIQIQRPVVVGTKMCRWGMGL